MTDDGGKPGLRVLDGGQEGSPVVQRVGRPAVERRYCQHHGLDLQESDRRVLCRDCGRTIDAFDALCIVAEQWERHAAHVRIRAAEARQAERRLEEVKRELSNAQARRRSAVKRGDLPPPRGSLRP